MKSHFNRVTTYLFDKGDDLLDAFSAVARLAQDLDDTVRAPGAADRVDRDPRSRRLQTRPEKKKSMSSISTPCKNISPHRGSQRDYWWA